MPTSVWAEGFFIQSHSTSTAVVSLRRMLADDVHTDITINTSDGGHLRAHCAVLATRSPVFWSMFSHNLKEKELSTIDIPDMSTESCQAFLNYIYGDIHPEEFLAHTSRRLAMMTSTPTSLSTPPTAATFARHRAVLATRSSHDLKEKELSTIDISDMSTESCQAFLNYIYGDIHPEEFLAHRLALLRAADKYDIADVKEACHDSLLEDIDAKNVLERLQSASLYCLPQLMSSCLKYLVRFAKVFDIREEFNVFLQCVDKELIAEVFQEVLAAWKGF